MAFNKGDRVELKRDLEGHGTQLEEGRQGTYRGTHSNEIRGKEVGYVNLDNDGGALRAVDTEDLKEA